MLIKAQSAAAVSRQNLSQDENSDSDKTQTILSQNSSNFSFITSLIWQFIKSIFEDTKDTMSIISVLIKAKEITSLNKSADWSEWNKKLRNYLSMIDLWKVLIDETFESSSDIDKHVVWSKKQKQLKRLLNLILNISIRSLIERITDKNATQQYKILENEYNKISINTFSQIHKRVFKCSLFNHKSIQKYDNEIIIARNKFIELERFIDKLTIMCVFLNKLDNSYQEWKNMWINSQDIYIKKNRKDLNVSKIEKIPIKLINRETSRKSNIITKD